ncbi:MAG: radical SAM protein [Nitrospinae bacterium]|nr:radical SAM protein [Nitrospinota bacterium]
MAGKGPAEALRVWANVYRRIRFFSKMYPLSSIAKDVFLFPVDYFLANRDIRSVRNITFAITHACNIRCEMCYFHLELGNRKNLPFDVYTRVIDSAAKSRPCVILSGGEPFAHPDILNMAEYAKGKGLPTQIFTNGTLVTPEKADKLAAMGLDYIDFTLLGDEVTHPQVANAPKSYEMLLRNLQYFAKNRRGVKIILNYTITPRSLKSIGHAVTLARELALDGIRFQHYNFLLEGETAAQGKAVKDIFGVDSGVNEITGEGNLEGAAEFIREFTKRLAAEAPSIPVQWAPTLTDSELDNWYSNDKHRTNRKCLYPWRGILVDADSKIYPCSKIYLELGSLADSELFDIWNGPRMKLFRKRLKNGGYPACSRCCKL